MSHDQRHFGRHSTVKAPAALLLALAVALSCVPALTTPVHAQEAAETPVAPHWIDLPAGKFFVGGDDALGLLGYAVVDETGGAPWWTSYTLLGGASALGVPVSRPFLLPDAHTYQAFEFGVLRWRPGLPLAEVAETLDLMWAAGRDEWLVSNGVPAMAAGPDHTHLARIGWLTHQPLRDAYFSAIHPTAESGLPAALLRFGLPAGPPASDATGTLQRFDRAALRWDAETAAVSVLPVGLLLARSDLLDDRVLAPDRFVGGLLIARAPRPLLNWPNSRGWGLPETGPRLSDTAPQRPPEGPAPAAAVTSPTPPTATPAALPAPPTPDPQRSTATSSPTTSQAPRPTPTGAPPASGASLVVKAIVNEGRTEHVVVANEGTAPQELTGWTLRSGTGGQQLAFPSGFILPPGATVNLHSGNGASTQNRPPTDLFATSQNVWNNQGDSALLVDPTGRVVSQLTYGG